MSKQIRFFTGYKLTEYELNKENKPVLKEGAKKTIDRNYEILPCGHQNNLYKKDRTSGICPKGCGDFGIPGVEEP